MPDVLGFEVEEACSRLEHLGWNVKREATQSTKPSLVTDCWRVVRCRLLNDKDVELVAAPVSKESCPDWVP